MNMEIFRCDCLFSSLIVLILTVNIASTYGEVNDEQQGVIANNKPKVPVGDAGPGPVANQPGGVAGVDSFKIEQQQKPNMGASNLLGGQPLVQNIQRAVDQSLQNAPGGAALRPLLQQSPNAGDPTLWKRSQNMQNRNNQAMQGQNIQQPQGMGQPLDNRQPRARNVKIAENPECAADVRSLCSETVATNSNNFAVLDCLQYDKSADRDVSVGCQHYLWTYKHNLTNDIRFDSAAFQVCKLTLDQMPDCNKLARGKGEIIPCMVENRSNITDASCQQFVKKMASIIFSDYRLICRFADRCKADIEKHKCGRLHAEGDDSPHSQGMTVECLSKEMGDVSEECKHEILRIAELQADDFHLDRPLFYACRDDRENFCSKVKSGGGKIFKCLFRHKFEREMTPECQEKLVLRQKLMQESYKVNRALSEACHEDIKNNECNKGDRTDPKHIRMSRILLCLEGALKQGTDINGDCQAEMHDMRRSLMEDYQISPDIVNSCNEEIIECGMHREGKTLHCLMSLARPKKGDKRENKISRTCMGALQDLIKTADAGEDFSLDPVLMEACEQVVDTACNDLSPGNGDVMSCLVEKIGTPVMVKTCEDHLIEIQYFVARDFTLEPRLYKFCHKDATKFCGAPKDWYDTETRTQSDDAPLVLSCLHARMKHPEKEQLERSCQHEVRRVMRLRASSVDLEPRIEEKCIRDLGSYCSENTEKGEEIDCLQDNYDNLEEPCKWAIGNFTEDESADIRLDKILMKSCMPMINKFCKDLIESENTEAGEIMQCLISDKNNPQMNEKCKAGVEHHQLIALEDYRFSYAFKEACKHDVRKICKGSRKKSDVIKCLSEARRNDTLLDAEQRLSENCRNELRAELLQRSENIELDEELHEACSYDQQEHCGNVTPGRAQIFECLKLNSNKLSDKCHMFIFKREKQQVEDSATDYTLMSTCKSMIKAYCMDMLPNNYLPCLKKNKDNSNFDSKCRKVIVERQRTQMTDIRLNPVLVSNCKVPLEQYCKPIMQGADEKHELQGKAIQCLRIKFAQQKLDRYKLCYKHMEKIIRESAIDYKQDPVLAQECKNEINTLCLAEKARDQDQMNGEVVECLKNNLADSKILNEPCSKEIARVLAEDREDVMVDPIVYKACQPDILHYCFDVPAGEGRQMSCLLSALEDTKVKLKDDCKRELSKRVKMWEYAVKLAPAETLEEFMDQIIASPQRNYFFSIFFLLILTIFIGGLLCGRVTKRVSQQMKNK